MNGQSFLLFSIEVLHGLEDRKKKNITGTRKVCSMKLWFPCKTNDGNSKARQS
jgi:hypothetical protein